MRHVALSLIAFGALNAAEHQHSPSCSHPTSATQAQQMGIQRLIADHPELQGVDPQSPEGRAKFQAAYAGDMKKRMEERQTMQHNMLKTAMGMTDEQFGVVKPLLVKLETLRMQKMMAERGGMGMPMNTEPLEPAAKELQEALGALRATLKDTKTTEFDALLGRVGKAKEGLKLAIGKAQDELLAGVNGRQKGILIEKGVVE